MSKKISYGTKAPFQDKPEIPVENKVIADDMNEIKEAVNGNADELDTAKQNIENLQGGQGTASADITNLKNRVTILEGDNKTNKTNISNLQNNKVDKVNGKGLSTEDFTTELKTKLENLENYDDTEITEAIQNFNNRIMRNSTNIETLQDNVAKLQESQEQQDTDIEAIKAENERLREDLKAFPSGQAEGEYITLKDSADSRFKEFVVKGNSKQETREGYNLLNAETVEEITGYKRFNINLKANVTYTLKFDEAIASGSNNTSLIRCLKSGNVSVMESKTIDTNTTNKITIQTTEDATQVLIYSYYDASSSINNTKTFKNLMIYEGTDDKEYEPYGVMPSPEYPSEIQNVEDNLNITVCNKNFFKILNNINKDYITVNGDNTFTINGTLQKNEAFAFSNMKLKKGTYTFSLGDYSKIKNCYYNIRDINTQEEISMFNYNDKNVKIDKDRYLEISFVIIAGTYNNVLITPQIEAGENKTAWIEHKEQNFKFPLSEGQKLYKGDYLASDGIHHVRKQVVLDGTENWMVSGNSYYLTVAGKKLRYELTKGKMLCTHFKETEGIGTGDLQLNEFFEGYYSTGNRNVFFNYDNGEGGVEGFKSYLSQQKQAGTPVILEYELEEEEIEAYTPEQQKAYNEIVQTAKSYKNVTNIFSADTVSPTFKVNYRKDIETMLEQVQVQTNAINELLSTTKTSATLLNNLQSDLESEVM